MDCLIWLNSNSGALTAVLTFVYVIATILICFFNYHSAKESKNQIVEMRQQFEEANRARVIPKLDYIEGMLACLVFQNVGLSFTENIKVDISEEWLKQLEKVQQPHKPSIKTADTLRKLKTTPFFLAPSDKYKYVLCVAADGTGNLEDLLSIPLDITIHYRSGNKDYSDSYHLTFEGNAYLINDSDYVRMEQKKRDVLSKIATSVNVIASNTRALKSDGNKL